MSLDVVTLVDPASGSRARLTPGFGFNCFSFEPRVDDQSIEVLWSAPGFISGEERPSHSGIPLLFPFPGRIGGGRVEFQGREYRVTDGTRDDGRGNAIHGFVLNRPWKVIEQSGQRVVGRFRASTVDPRLLDVWPADYELTVSYEVRGSALLSEITVHNPDDKPLPFGLGTHPYFRVPLGPRGEASTCRIQVPVGDVWPLENMLPSGERKPAEGRFDLAHGQSFEQTQFDDVFSGLPEAVESHQSTIHDARAGRRLTMTFSRGFRAAVVYNPPHREAICIEPYTCIPDYFALSARKIDPGMVVLPPGDSVHYRIAIELA